MSQAQLIREHDGKVIFEGSYVKYYPNPNGPGVLPFCALFQEYPATETSIKICKRVTSDSAKSNMNICKLISQGSEVGCYVPIATVHSEQEANNRVNANYRGIIAAKNATLRPR